MPSDWNTMSLDSIKAFGSDFKVTVDRREDGKLEITVLPAGGKEKRYTVKPGQTTKINL